MARGEAHFKQVNIIGVPLDHGAGRRGVNMGPSAMRIAQLQSLIERLGYEVNDLGDLPVPSPEAQSEAEINAKFLGVISKTCQSLAEQVCQTLKDGAFPLVIGGDHSMAVGSIAGAASYLHEQGPDTVTERLGVIWFDAHGDTNTPATSPSGNIHGMPLACLLGHGPDAMVNVGYDGPKLKGRNVSMIGLRDLDDEERRIMHEAGIHIYTMHDIDRLGMAQVIEKAVEFATNGTDHLHVSFDIDSLDPRVAPGTGTQSLGGLTYREAHLALEIIAETHALKSFEMAEVNPILDNRNQTSEIAVQLIASALGSRIFYK